MNVLDVGLLAFAFAYAVSGFRRGFLVGVLSFVGFLAGGVVGMLVAPSLLRSVTEGAAQALAAVAVVLALATVGQLLLTLVAARLRGQLTWRPARLLDAGLGAAAGVVSVLLVSWFLATAVRDASAPALSRAVSDSRILRTVDAVMPDAARGLFGSFRRVIAANGLPRVFSGLAPERILPVPPPDPAVVRTAGIRAAGAGVVKIVGSAGSCDRQVEGSGFVYAAEHVLTNAHVVAGVRGPTVQAAGVGPLHQSTVVAYDPRRDLAVLYVPGLRAPALRFDPSARRGTLGVVAGFPRAGPYRLDAARVREQINARGPDIYGNAKVTRAVFSLYALVQPGNSGGPVLSPAGRVYGVVFAKSLDDARTGYALTVSEAQAVATPAAGARAAVSTGRCAE